MERAVFVYTTYPSVVEAEQSGRALVEQRLCACVNILPGMVSLYWWQGKVDRGEAFIVQEIFGRFAAGATTRASVVQSGFRSIPRNPRRLRPMGWQER